MTVLPLPAGLRVGIVDFMTAGPDGTARHLFSRAVDRAAQQLGCTVETTAYGVDTSRSVDLCGIDWTTIGRYDALVVTGSEPRHRSIGAEPLLPVVKRLLDVTRSDTEGPTSILFSCQSAHAALHIRHGLRRRRMDTKCVGVFDHWVSTTCHPLTAGMKGVVQVPQSRWNTVPSTELREAGVTPVLDSVGSDWTVAASADGLRHVFLQGHPEYLPDTLLREFRRDLRRYLAGESPTLPDLPHRTFSPSVEATLRNCVEHAAEHRDIRQLDVFPHLSEHDVTSGWTADSHRFFANWLRGVRHRIRVRPTPARIPSEQTGAPC
ncbi:homoserine O-succinyltransferase [Streptomyces sp. P17]|uniref:homoserine O-acetyltransferase/O-succinyltransferase family protein n=1 Tax=Streptomyces sp. P17 TaxID=3074716 RepID=UPI0028F3F17D|nr:homoserine O-succinyltransferase [Streptomyces sp. P17]MDT9698130.1 homoserine O-succinyltransferase [Streptomyces sp. P17]